VPLTIFITKKIGRTKISAVVEKHDWPQGIVHFNRIESFHRAVGMVRETGIAADAVAGLVLIGDGRLTELLENITIKSYRLGLRHGQRNKRGA